MVHSGWMTDKTIQTVPIFVLTFNTKLSGRQQTQRNVVRFLINTPSDNTDSAEEHIKVEHVCIRERITASRLCARKILVCTGNLVLFPIAVAYLHPISLCRNTLRLS